MCGREEPSIRSKRYTRAKGMNKTRGLCQPVRTEVDMCLGTWELVWRTAPPPIPYPTWTVNFRGLLASCYALPYPGPGIGCPLPPTPRDVPSCTWMGQWPGPAGALRCVRTATIVSWPFPKTSNTRSFSDLQDS